MNKPEEEKIFSAQNLRSRLDRIGKEKQIVFTNGCFDVLHPGHIYCLTEASHLGDFLIVGINSDDSVRRLKGPNRPLISEDERALMLSALVCVDAIVIFDEDTPVSLIRSLLPDIYVKGSDYAEKEIPERAEVQSYGGRVEFVELKPGWSTTGFLEKLHRLK
jgi:rfaE bifunctional protein nucleotidyltransferase chain/domain